MGQGQSQGDEMSGENAETAYDARLPEIVLVDPPALPAGRHCAVVVHLAKPIAEGQEVELVCRRGQEVMGRQLLNNASGTVVCYNFEPLEARCMHVAFLSEEGVELSPRCPLLVLPERAADEAYQLFQQTVDMLKYSDREFQMEFLEQDPANANSADEPPEKLMNEMAWRKNFKKLAQDFGGILDHLWYSHYHGVESPTVPGDVEVSLHHVLVYLMENEAWAIVGHLLRACCLAGLPITVNGNPLSEADMVPECLQGLAESLRQEYDSTGPGRAHAGIGFGHGDPD